MKIGKLPTRDLQNLVLDAFYKTSNDIVLYPSVGEDCGAISFGEQICVASTDPITATESEIGRLAVHINCNDIASSGAIPVGILTTILLPPNSTEDTLSRITKQIAQTAENLGVAVIGGHTEITDAVNKIVISATAIGKVDSANLISTKGAKPNDILIMTKNIALEGTAILAYEYEEKLKEILTLEEIEYAKNMMNNISVVKEGILAGKSGIHAMHDVTEGGIIGAIWEMCEASNLGCVLYKEKFPINDVTKKITDYFHIDPLKLISSGVMLMSIDSDNADKIVDIMRENNIVASIIGKLTNKKQRYLLDGEHIIQLEAVASDELYKVCE